MSISDQWANNRKVFVLIVTWMLVTALLVVAAIDDDIFEFEDDDDDDELFTSDFDWENLNFTSTGRNDYFILEPGYRLFLTGFDAEEDDALLTLEVLVTNDTEMVGNVETRVVIETEFLDGELLEVSFNYFAMEIETKNMFYFGEQTNDYEDGVIVSTEGEWRADDVGSAAGIIMPGTILFGARYQQETAPGVAMDRATIVGTDKTIVTPAGTFTNALEFFEENPIDGDSEYKYFANGIGLVQDEDLLLEDFGFVTLL